jgi:hypothetical protein
MHKTSLAKTFDQNEAPGVAQLRSRIARIVQDEFGGDLCTGGIWLAAAQRAAERVMEALGGGTRHPIPVSSVNVSLAGAGTRRSDSHRR